MALKLAVLKLLPRTRVDDLLQIEKLEVDSWLPVL